jgi:4-amino-4-deoxy-L-arabinose transferase-like glycosyltransferase
LLLIAAALRFWRLGDLALIGDESYYWLWSRHLDWAYFDHPAGVALQVWLSTLLGGQTEAGIRWLNAALGASSTLLVYLLGARLLSRRAGLVAALAVAVGAPYLLTSRFVYTDALQLFLLLLNLYWFWRLTESARTRSAGVSAIAFGVSLALLFNTKYSAYLYAGALALALLIDYRPLLGDKRLWLAGFIAAVGLVPVVAWNAAHDWVSFRWQLAHFGFSLTGQYSLLGTVGHSLTYLSWPLVFLALLGFGLWRRPAERLLGVVALILLLPVALSPANSPRNLSTGLVLLLLLAGNRWPNAFQRRQQQATAGILALLLVGIGIYGFGSVIGTLGPSRAPQSSVASSIRQDAAGWRQLGPELARYPEPLFALDYSIASQIRYYSGLPAYTSWGQYQIWGIPEFHDATVASLDYLSETFVTSQLENAFQQIEGPWRFSHQEPGARKTVHLWEARGLILDQETFLERFDFLTLLEASR